MENLYTQIDIVLADRVELFKEDGEWTVRTIEGDFRHERKFPSSEAAQQFASAEKSRLNRAEQHST